MKKLLLSVVLLGLLGCGEPSHRDIPKAEVSTYCIEGVTYYYLSNGLVPAFGRDSKVILCEEKTYEP
jgi:hypothetical protein